MGKLKKMALWQKILLSLFVLLLVSLGGAYFYIHNLLDKTEKVEINKENLGITPENKEIAVKNKGITNIALFGVDAQNGNTGRSDAIMILTIDNDHDKIKLSSIMRDSYTNISGRGNDKITHAYAFGGPELALNTINKNFNLSIDKFITVNFTTLPKIVDKIGGIEMNLTEGDLKYMKYSDLTTGKNTLNGTQALSYARIRYDGGDQRRTERHRNVITAIFNKIKSMPVSSYPGTLNELLPLVSTNISSSQFMTLGKDIISTGATSIEEYRVPCNNHSNGKNINGVYYMTFDIGAETKELHKFIYENN
ncbi:cell envelope-related function transcriptional attenuator common domain protein [Clostridium baratii str. Sullivan]|uniref:Cell envelope-related function transcriptional attenuator common domain protein n=1 Tax=Clostridium baratii str. Sullivan TaxID=1415775 RepID=A0A0A7G0G7_9CLOT|nr:LCP family protein [Clostridium baratii]AIY84685.1 cell envelope-related function transcriptional attenuator common domain protein [Clostridium baratii str. Sullivan]